MLAETILLLEDGVYTARLIVNNTGTSWNYMIIQDILSWKPPVTTFTDFKHKKLPFPPNNESKFQFPGEENDYHLGI